MISKNQIKAVKQLEQKKHRQREGLFVAEGPKVVGDLLAAGFEPHSIFATEEWQHPSFTSRPSPLTSNSDKSELFPEVSRVTPEELRKLSFLQHPQQVLAVFRLPSQPQSPPSNPDSQIILALDDIQDPGNLGTIIRIADWFGVDLIVCSTATADAWSPKVVQATMGSIARIPIVYTDLKQYLSTTQLTICGTFLDGNNIYTSDLPRHAVVVMGNEGNGISPEIGQLVSQRLLIPPTRPGAESLNVAVATAITLSEFRRQSQ